MKWAPIAQILRSAPGWQYYGSTIDIDFQRQRARWNNAGCSLTSLLSIIRTTNKYVADSTGLYRLVTPGLLALSNRGLLIEDAKTNIVLHNRDFTNAAWAKTNITAAKDQIGVDGVASAASKITASAAGGTVLQAITSTSAARVQTAHIKRVTGTGTLEMTMDNGGTWTDITSSVGTSYAQIKIPNQTITDPTVGFRIGTDTDAFAVDFFQNENVPNTNMPVATSPIETTTVAVARNEDGINMVGGLLHAVRSGEGTFLFSMDAAPTSTVAVGRLIGSAGVSTYGGVTNTTSIRITNNSVNLDATFPSGSVLSAYKVAFGFDASGRISVINNGTVVSDATAWAVIATTAPRLCGDVSTANRTENSYIRRLTYWPRKLDSATIKALTV